MREVDQAVQSWYGSVEKWTPCVRNSAHVDWCLLQQGDLIENKVVLNLGCFYPVDELAFAARSARWEAIDFTPKVITRCQAMSWPAHVHFSLMDMRNLQFDDNEFDVVIEFSAGDHIDLESYEIALREAHRVLKPDGLFVLAFSDREWFADHYEYWKTHRFEQGGTFGYMRADTVDEMRGMLTDAGFKIDFFLPGEGGRMGVLSRK